MSEAEIVKRAVTQLQEAHEWELPILLKLPDLCSMVAALQLSLRHPGNDGATADAVRAIIDGVIGCVEESGLADVARLLRCGDNRRFDQ